MVTRAPHPLTPRGLIFTGRLTRLWWREVRRRWPLLVAIMRGGEVAYGMTFGPPEECLINIRRGGAIIMDCTLDGGSSRAGIRL